jgi:serine/threonine protein kinase
MQVRRRSNGQLLTLNAELGGGGEGKIYPVAQDSSWVAKIYHQPTAEIADKLAAMVAHPPEDPSAAEGHVSIAWPLDLLEDRGRVVGFLMPKVNQVRPIHDFYNPKTRRDHTPFFNYLYLHRTARNLAAAVSSLHAGGYVIGDVNESNILVSQTALVTLVDTDSFQVRVGKQIYPCPVGKPEFTPPELQGKTLRHYQRTPEQDRFGLAVLIFQVLMEGTHPFAGVYTGLGDPPPIESRIAAGHFPYGTRRVPYRPTPIAPDGKILHPDLRRLFLQCFDTGYLDPSRRPDAQTWVQVLEAAEQELVICQTNPQHRYSDRLTRCPWCDRTQLLGGRDPFPSKKDIHRWRTPPPQPPPRPPRQPRLPISVSVRSSVATFPAIQYQPIANPSVGGFWSQVAQCKNDLLAGSVVLAMVLGGVVYWSARSASVSASKTPVTRQEGVATASFVSVPTEPTLMAIARLYGHSDRVRAVAFAPDGKSVASSSSDGTMKLWHLPTQKLRKSLDRAGVGFLAFSTNGHQIIGSTKNAIHTWQVSDGELVDRSEILFDSLPAIATRPQNSTLLVGRLEGQLVRWDVNTGESVALPLVKGDRLITTSTDGQILVTADTAIEVWDAQTGKAIRTLEKENQTKISAVAVSADGKLLASSTGTDNGMIRLWEIKTGNLLHEESASFISSIAFSPDGKTLIAGERYGSIGVWQISGVE